MLAQLYPRQAAKRMQQAATIAKAELEFVKYVHGVESEEYLNMLIEAGKLLLQLQPQTKKITEMSLKFLKEATEHALFEEKKSAEQKSQLIILVAMSSILSGKVDESLTYIFKGIDSYKEVFEPLWFAEASLGVMGLAILIGISLFKFDLEQFYMHSKPFAAGWQSLGHRCELV